MSVTLGLTIIREILRDWIPIYLQESAGVSPSDASLLSAMEPAAGGISTIYLAYFVGISSLLLGYMMDKEWGKKRRGFILGCFLTMLLIPLIILWIQNEQGSQVNLASSLIMLSAVGFCMTGPYALTSIFSIGLVSSGYGRKVTK
jgi:sugar phosphate permease